MKISRTMQGFAALLLAVLLLAPMTQPLHAQDGEGADGGPAYDALMEFFRAGVVPTAPEHGDPVFLPFVVSPGGVAEGIQAAAAPCPSPDLRVLRAFPNDTPSPDSCRGVANDGTFIDASVGLATLGNPPATGELVNLEIEVPKTLTEFTLSIFDGDNSDNWDILVPPALPALPIPPTPFNFKLYADPDRLSNTTDLVGAWLSSGMVDDQWCDLDSDGTFSCDGFASHGAKKIQQDPSSLACSAPGNSCYYHFVSDFDGVADDQANFFKIAVSDLGRAYVLAGSTIGFQSADVNYDKCGGLFEFNVPCWRLNRTAYTGEFSFNFEVVADPGSGETPFYLDLYDGDFDLGLDSDDLNSPSQECWTGPAFSYPNGAGATISPVYENAQEAVAPNENCSILIWDDIAGAWVPSKGYPNHMSGPDLIQSPAVLAEGANSGSPYDDFPFSSEFVKFSPDIQWEVAGPSWKVENLDPSGNREWELFRIGTPVAPPVGPVPATDEVVDEIPVGLYTWTIKGADANNNLFIYLDYDLFSSPPKCDLEVTKICQVDGPSDLQCKAKIRATTLRYTGEPIFDATVTFSGKADGFATYTVAELKDGDVLTGQDGWTVNGSPGDLGAKTTIVITGKDSGGADVDYTEVIHTSCSTIYYADAPAPLDNPKGAPSPTWFVESFIDKNGDIVTSPSQFSTLCEVPEGGADVTYTYNVSNIGASTFNGVTLSDNQFDIGSAGDLGSLAPGASEEVVVTKFIDQPVVNTATVNGIDENGLLCLADATVEVVVGEPAPCEVSSEAIRFHGRELKWKVTNDGVDELTIENITVNFPNKPKKLKEIKVGRDKIWSGRLNAPGGTVQPNDHLNKAVIQPGKTVEFKFKFEKDPKADQGVFELKINFTEGCAVENTPTGDGDFACEKPIDALTMIWDGGKTITSLKAWKDKDQTEALIPVPDSNITSTTEVTVSGYAPRDKGDGNDVVWEMTFADGTTGQSVFHMSCSDDDMDGADDCGKREGDSKGPDKGYDGYVNDWLLEGMVDAVGTLDCTP